MTGICLPIDASGGSPAFPAAQHRVGLSALMGASPGRTLGARSGLRLGVEPTVTVTSTTWTVTPFSCVVDPGTALTVGPYLCAFTANQTGAVNAADASAQRIDRLDVQVPDDPPSGARVASIIYTAGTPGGSAPAAPARSMPLGTITVPKAGGGSPVFTAAWPYLPAAPIPVSSQAERDALPTYRGLSVIRLDKGGRVDTYDGATWSGARTAMVSAAAVTFNGSGIGTLAHGLPWTPSAAVVSQNGASGSGGAHIMFISADATNLTLKAFLVTTGAVASGGIGVTAYVSE